MSMTTLYINFKPSLISDRWLADVKELETELTALMPDVRLYFIRGFRPYKWYVIEHITGCSNGQGEVYGREIQLNVMPSNL